MLTTALQDLIEKLNKSNIYYKKEQTVAPLTSFKIGGICPLIIEPHNTDSLITTVSILNENEIAYKLLGGGTNILVSDHPNDFVLIRPEGEFKGYQNLDNGRFKIGAAALTTPVFRQISQLGYTGAEFLSTIPGRVGGAVIQNAGCYGGELFQLIHKVEYIKNTTLLKEGPELISHGYRSTQFKETKDSIITSIEIDLPFGDILEIEQSLKEKRDKRNASQPGNKKSAGSVFKNPDLKDNQGNPFKSWQLIDKAGLRGKQKGDAIISPEHCNFIVNLGKATAADVHYLIELVMEQVFKTSGVLLEKEIEYFGQIP